MYLSSTEIAQGHQHTLNNFQTASAACVTASERLADLFLRLGRQQLQSLSNPRPGGGWLCGVQSQSAIMLSEMVEIVGDTQQTVIIAAASQSRIVDQLLVTSLERARKTSPVEALPALDGLRHSVTQAEQILCGWAEAARQSVALAERQISQVAASSS